MKYNTNIIAHIVVSFNWYKNFVNFAQLNCKKFVQYFISNTLTIFIEYVIIYSMNKTTGTAEPELNSRELEKNYEIQ